MLARLGVACVVDLNGCSVNDFEYLQDGGKYTLGPPQQLLQQEFEKILAFVQSEMDDRTKNKEMSKASTD